MGRLKVESKMYSIIVNNTKLSLFDFAIVSIQRKPVQAQNNSGLSLICQ